MKNSVCLDLEVYYEKTHMLEARLRPEDRFCKPLVGKSQPVTNLVLRVRRSRHRRGREEGGGANEGPRDCQVEVLGVVKQAFEFKGIPYNIQCQNYKTA